MLVLSRKLGDRIYIGNDIRITIVDVDRGKVRVGIEAPSNVDILREEILPEGERATYQKFKVRKTSGVNREDTVSKETATQDDGKDLQSLSG